MNGSDKPREECAVFGASLFAQEAAGLTYNGLLSMQHRGQEGTGIAVLSGSNIVCHKDTGLVNEVFVRENLGKIPKSKLAVGHNRYSTTGRSVHINLQPFVTEYLTGRIAAVHNGNVTNAGKIKRQLMARGLNFNATSDTEVIASLIAYHCMREKDALKGVIRAADELEGAFTLIILSSEKKLIAVRDGSGYRPLCIGRGPAGLVVASESCALDSCGFRFVRDVRPGEVVVIENGEVTYEKVILQKKDPNSGLCIFEYVYFARPDSDIDGLSVYEARHNMGRVLAREHPVAADAVCGVPDSGLEAAIGYAGASGLPLVSGFVKNRYIGRSFIFPTQSERESAVKMKLNPLRANLRGKSIVLVDDSIVRGTTSEKIVTALKQAGAREVHMRISSPPFRYACYFGTDIDTEENLIANKMDLDAIRDKIGADSLGYISIEGLKTACEKAVLPFCTKCFTGHGCEGGGC
ncbi:MAG: amidophosphoribosyltransferase [Oscillospiraceae bacterium]|nr:amidophosphoribosyltransferase [Oscillospiraceae bacterium]